jgi:cardiolipin synthase
LLRRRAEIWEYQPCRLHMKLIVIDDIVYIGTANFDIRSLFLNVEVMLRIADRGFADQMRGFIARMQPECEMITRASHKARAGWLTRLRWALAWFVVGIFDYSVSRKLNFGLAEPDFEI